MLTGKAIKGKSTVIGLYVFLQMKSSPKQKFAEYIGNRGQVLYHSCLSDCLRGYY